MPDERLPGGPGAGLRPVLAGTEAIAAVAAGALSVSDVVEACLGRVAELDPAIGAFRLVDEHGARGRAKELDDRVAGPLQGLVAGVKDVIDTAGLPTGYGSGLFADHQPAADADVVTALRQARAIVLGKTESTEFAMFAPARTRNPVDPARTPGGSSSGSAAAVAAGMVPVALGTQTAGSVVRPAAYCGVYGFKPAWGWTSTKGIWRLSGHLDTVGLFARRVSDLLLTYQALRSPGEQARSPCGPAAAAHPPGKPSVAVLSGQEWADCDGDVRDALSWVAGLSTPAGRSGRWPCPPPGGACPDSRRSSWRPRWRETCTRPSATGSARYPRAPRPSSSGATAAWSASTSPRSRLSRRRCGPWRRSRPPPTWCSPRVPWGPRRPLDYTGDPVMCRPWTLLGLPAANVPCWRRPDGLPVGVQLVGTGRDDLTYLTCLALAEAAVTHKED